MDVEDTIKRIIRCAYTVRKALPPGFLEKVYKNALFIELRDNGIMVDTEVPMDVLYKGRVVGSYRADMVVGKQIIVELKAIQHLAMEHEVQLVNYLNALNIDNGLLINFGGEKIEIKRKYKQYRKL